MPAPAVIPSLYIYDSGIFGSTLGDLPHTLTTLQTLTRSIGTGTTVATTPIEIKIQTIDALYSYICDTSNIYRAIKKNSDSTYDFTDMFKIIANTKNSANKAKVIAVINFVT